MKTNFYNIYTSNPGAKTFKTNCLHEKKISLALRAQSEKDMYKTVLFGKEWHWRNVKMETRDANTVLWS